MMNIAFDAFPNIFTQVVNPAGRALLLACATGLALWAFRVKSTSLRLFAWTAVLYAALAMPLLGWMLPPLSLPTPASFRSADTPSRALPSRRWVASAPIANSTSIGSRKATRKIHSESVPGPSQSTVSTIETSSVRRPFDWLSIPWGMLATGIYFVVTLLLLTRFVIGIFLSRRLVHAARTILDHRLHMKVSRCARATSPDSVPRIAESEMVTVPVTIGVLQSHILLPTNWREWDDAKLDAVIAHEVSHIARRDPLTQRVSLVHRAIFWFSPLAWWLDRHLSNLAEQASDEAALYQGADRNEYARTLLGFFEALHTAPGRVWWQGVSMAKTGSAEQRLERILGWRGATMGLKKSILVAIIAFGIPVVYLAASARPGYVRAQAATAALPAQLQATPTSGAPTPAGSDVAPPAAPNSSPAAPPSPQVGITSGARPIAPVAAAPPLPPAYWAYQTDAKSHYNYSYRDDDEQRFVIVTGNSDSLTMSGTSEDARHAEKLKKQIPGDFIWFERDEKSYIIRDQVTIDRARKLWAPQEELGKKQEELGKQQEALGRQQEELGKQMENVFVKVPDIFADLDRLKAELKQLGSNATVDQLGKLQSEIGELQSRIGATQSQAGEQQSKLGEQMGALGEKQGKLGEQQGELGRQQGELAEKASREMEQLLDEAIKKGTAQPEPQTGGTGML